MAITTITTIDTLEDLQQFIAAAPEGTTVDILSDDLEAGNFEEASMVFPSVRGETPLHIHYTGPVAEGYVSPFDGNDEK
jgi:hypothetical protein